MEGHKKHAQYSHMSSLYSETSKPDYSHFPLSKNNLDFHSLFHLEDVIYIMTPDNKFNVQWEILERLVLLFALTLNQLCSLRTTQDISMSLRVFYIVSHDN